MASDLWMTLGTNVQKRISHFGSGFAQPVLGTKCVISVVPSVEAGGGEDKPPDLQTSLINSGFTIGEKIEVTLGLAESTADMLVEQLVMTMVPSEQSRFRLQLKELHLTQDYKLPKCCDTVYLDLSLHDMDDVKPLWDMSAEEKFISGLFHKEKGNNFFKEDKTEAAFLQYSNAIKYLISIPTYSPMVLSISQIEPMDKEKYDDLKCQCFLNLAACQAKFANHKDVISNCTDALILQPSNVKGLYRRAQAYLSTGKAAQARDDLQRAKKIEPNNKAVIALLSSCSQLQQS